MRILSRLFGKRSDADADVDEDEDEIRVNVMIDRVVSGNTDDAEEKIAVGELVRETGEILGAYGEALEKKLEAGDKKMGIVPESMLPYPKDKIKRAIRIGFRLGERSGIETLVMGYETLAKFFPDEEADKIFANVAAGQGLLHFVAVQKKVQTEKEKLLRELLKYLSRLSASRKDIKEGIEDAKRLTEGRLREVLSALQLANKVRL